MAPGLYTRSKPGFVVDQQVRVILENSLLSVLGRRVNIPTTSQSLLDSGSSGPLRVLRCGIWTGSLSVNHVGFVLVLVFFLSFKHIEVNM